MMPVVVLAGALLLPLAILMLLPAALLALDGAQGAGTYLGVAGGTALLGALLAGYGARHPLQFRSRQLFAGTTLSWLVLSLAAALPLMLEAPHLSFTDAMFESLSAITTTGSTVIAGLDHLPRGVLLWRCLIQWLGGIGIIVVGIAVLPFLRIGGMRLFHTESSDWSDKAMPRTSQLAGAIGGVYVGLTLACAAGYALAGMTVFDAACHAMTTISTGGFANYDASFGTYAGRPWLLVLASAFMLAGGLPFVLYVKGVQRGGLVRELVRDDQVRGAVAFIALTSAVLAAHLVLQGSHGTGDALVHALFNVVSVVTTTGYASQDYGAWSNATVVVMFVIMLVGCCSGSTSGGLKIFRIQLGFAVLHNQLRALVHPSGTFLVRFNRHRVPDEVLHAVLGFTFFYLATIAVLALALGLIGLDPLTSLSGAITAVANVGPGLGPVIGPAGNFAPLPDVAKWLLGFGMLLGRLEIMTVLVLLTPTFWRA